MGSRGRLIAVVDAGGAEPASMESRASPCLLPAADASSSETRHGPTGDVRASPVSLSLLVPMALLGAAVVVLLNIGRLVAGGAGLFVVPLSDGLQWKKLKKWTP